MDEALGVSTDRALLVCVLALAVPLALLFVAMLVLVGGAVVDSG